MQGGQGIVCCERAVSKGVSCRQLLRIAARAAPTLLGRCTGKHFNIALFHLLTKPFFDAYLAAPNHLPLTPRAQPSVKSSEPKPSSSKSSGAKPTLASTKSTRSSKSTRLKPVPTRTSARTGKAKCDAQVDQDDDNKACATTSPESESEYSESKTKDSEERESTDVCTSCMIQTFC